MIEIVALGGEVSCVEHQFDPAIGMERLADHPVGVRQDAVLDIAEIEEPERLRLCGGGAELHPFRPAGAAFEAVGIDGVGRQFSRSGVGGRAPDH